MLSESKQRLKIKYYLKNNKALDDSIIEPTINRFYKRLYGDRYNIYDIIPKNKISEEEDNIHTLSHGLEGVSENAIDDYDKNIVKTFSKIERNGLYTEDGYE